MIKVFTVDSESPSVTRLGFQTNVQISGFVRDYNNDVCVRFGNSKKLYENSRDKSNQTNYRDFPNVLNLRTSIRANVNKLLALEKLSGVVSVPNILRMEVPNGTKAVIRNYEHSSGSGFEIVNGPIDINWRQKFGTQFLECEKEFRVWTIGNKTLVGKRIATTPEQQRQFPCRSKWGYSFHTDGFPRLREQAIQAAQALNLDISAADVLWDENQRKYVFLELNSCPTIEGQTLIRFFQNGIRDLARQKFPRLTV